MSENSRNFHEIAITSALFKGRSDWYFCYLKSERIAHVLLVLSNSVQESRRGELQELSRAAGNLPGTVVHFAAGEVDADVVLADMFSLLSTLRLLQTSGDIGKDNATTIAQEYESLIEKFAASVHLSPFASADDFSVPELDFGNPHTAVAQSLLEAGMLGKGAAHQSPSLKDINKGQSKGHSGIQAPRLPKSVSKEQQVRAESILDFVRQNKRVSIKDIAGVVRDCSEKTIQRELGVLIQQGLVQKVGQRRWSVYMPA